MNTPKERRRHRRFDTPCRLRVQLPTGEHIRTRTMNVSDGGAYFLTEDAVEAGQEVNVRVAVPRDTANTFFLEQFAAAARVLRCDHLDGRQPGTGVALKFEKELALDLV
jgi:c-di-GMP-binding flagellar brake protein YcgR